MAYKKEMEIFPWHQIQSLFQYSMEFTFFPWKKWMAWSIETNFPSPDAAIMFPWNRMESLFQYSMEFNFHGVLKQTFHLIPWKDYSSIPDGKFVSILHGVHFPWKMRWKSVKSFHGILFNSSNHMMESSFQYYMPLFPWKSMGTMENLGTGSLSW